MDNTAEDNVLNFPKKKVAPGFDPKLADAVDNKVKVRTWEDTLQLNKNGSIMPRSASNAYTVINHAECLDGVLAYNEFTDDISIRHDVTARYIPAHLVKGNANTSTMGDIQALVDNEQHVTFSNDLITNAVLASAKQHSFNPLLDHLSNARQLWEDNGKPKQLDKIFVDVLGAKDDDNTLIATRLFFSGLITRAHENGHKFDFMTILYSKKQGIGKTTLLSKIGGEYYSDALRDMNSKDSVQLVAKKWLVNDDELTVLQSSKFSVIKKFISQCTDEARPAYKPLWEKFPRRFVLAGTTNEQSILKDATGSRRFTIITCGVGEIKRKAWNLTQQDIDMYLGEAEYRYQHNEASFFTNPSGPDMAALQQAQKSFESIDGVSETIETVLNAKYPADWWNRPIGSQRQYVINLLDGKDESSATSKPINAVSVTWLLEVAFDIDSRNDTGTQREKRLRARVSEIMNTQPMWEKSGSTVAMGKRRARGYKRIRTN